MKGAGIGQMAWDPTRTLNVQGLLAQGRRNHVKIHNLQPRALVEPREIVAPIDDDIFAGLDMNLRAGDHSA